MRFDGSYIGDIPENILTGKVTVKNLNYIIDIINKVYKEVFKADLGLALNHIVGEGYAIISETPQIWMQGHTEWASSDKPGVYMWLKNCMYECIVLLENWINENKIVNREYILWKNQLQFIFLWLDRPLEDYKELNSKLEI